MSFLVGFGVDVSWRWTGTVAGRDQWLCGDAGTRDLGLPAMGDAGVVGEAEAPSWIR